MITATTQLPPKPASSEAARQFVGDQLEEWNYPWPYDDVLLVASELVSNVVRHAGGEVRLRLAFHEGCLRLEVGDDSPELPMMREPGPDGGFGLMLVDKICKHWGVNEIEGKGKVVWCECPGT